MDFRALLKHKEDEKKRRNAEERDKSDLKHGTSFEHKNTYFKISVNKFRLSAAWHMHKYSLILADFSSFFFC